MRCPQNLQPQIANRRIQVRREDTVAVVNQKPIRVVGRNRFTKLLKGPLRRRVSRHIAVQQPPGAVFHDHKDIEQAEGGGHSNTEVASDDGLGMIANKRRPALIASRGFPVVGVACISGSFSVTLGARASGATR